MADPDNELPPRRGLDKLFDNCDERGIKVASTSDANIDSLKCDLTESGVDIERFDKFFCLNQIPKDYRLVIAVYDIPPRELLVIGRLAWI